MKFTFENLGPLKKGSLEINNITVICGRNNTGKTYINYAIYGFYETLYEVISEVVTNLNLISCSKSKCLIDLAKIYKSIPEINKSIIKTYSIKMPQKVFNTANYLFKECKIQYTTPSLFINRESFIESYCENLRGFLNKTKETLAVEQKDSLIIIVSEENSSIILKKLILEKVLISTLYFTVYNIHFNSFFLPAERSGLNILFKELNLNRNELMYNLDSLSSMHNKISRYPLSIKNYLNFLNEQIPNKDEEASSVKDFNEITSMLEKDIVGGSYILNDDYSIDFKIGSANNMAIDFHLASSTARTLFGLDLYMKYKITIGDLLIIDEPELNLHPDNQRKLARILAKLANKGIKVLISTHSDYIVQEFNNLIMLSRNFRNRDKIMKKYNYQLDEIITPNNINAYISQNDSIIKAEIATEGIIINTFDEVINSYNKSSDEIYYGYLEDHSL